MIVGIWLIFIGGRMGVVVLLCVLGVEGNGG